MQKVGWLGQSSRRQVQFWLLLSVAIALTYSGMALQDGFSSAFVVQDDARQHVVWMQRFLDPELFPNDLISDYYQAIAPTGYAAFYRAFAGLGIDPLLLNRLLPPFLGLLATLFGFGVAMELLPLPGVAFVSCLLLNQYLWVSDDIASATARGFMPPLMLAFVYGVIRRSQGRCWQTLLVLLSLIVLEGLFYPSYVLVFASILALLPLRWEKGRLRRTRERRDYLLMAAGLGAAFLVLLPHLLESSPYGPMVTVAEARSLPEFSGSGRTAFFENDFGLYWLSGRRSGILPTIHPSVIGLGLLLPLLALFPQTFPLVRQISPRISILVRWGGGAIALFLLAHLLLFRLYLPSRYTHYSLQFILVFLTAITLAVLLDAALRWVRRSQRLLGQGLVWGLAGAIASALLLYPLYAYEFPRTEYRVGQYPALYDFLRSQPKETLVASVLLEADSISSFAQRPVYISREHAIPYHVGYAQEIRQRAHALIEALYTLDLSTLQAFIQQSGVDYWMITPAQFTSRFLHTAWIVQYPAAIAPALQNLGQGMPAIARYGDRCTVLTTPAQPLNPATQSRLIRRSDTWIQTDAIALVDSACLLRQ